ncbi:DDE_Tnp_1_7 domain-containing protein [Trichonephila clavipes]|uniref:DDE_Tnp_1_7 domain-containing protein n=1 Tax=Trichonephila clavipes TaxID=2585209 RepID=A0A8X6SXG1_TRICX|nr:DDE_Tnp_1_7 domain-containing protein [Trichonephila clavipes]
MGNQQDAYGIKKLSEIYFVRQSFETFWAMLRVIRFDNKCTRQEKRKLNNLAPVRDIGKKWIEILPKLYNLNENITVDEQIEEFRDRCPFEQYVPKDTAVVNFIPKKNKNVILMSTLHRDKEVSNRLDKNPTIILDCNSAKELWIFLINF